MKKTGKHEIFISQSQPLSIYISTIIKQYLTAVFNCNDNNIYISQHRAENAVNQIDRILTILVESKIAIAIYTDENIGRNWMLYENALMKAREKFNEKLEGNFYNFSIGFYRILHRFKHPVGNDWIYIVL